MRHTHGCFHPVSFLLNPVTTPHPQNTSVPTESQLLSLGRQRVDKVLKLVEEGKQTDRYSQHEVQGRRAVSECCHTLWIKRKIRQTPGQELQGGWPPQLFLGSDAHPLSCPMKTALSHCHLQPASRSVPIPVHRGLCW